MRVRNRRQFLASLSQMAGAATAGMVLPAPLQRALAIPAHYRTGTLKDVEHIVILTQENRSFDHYFGSLGGVRGFADPLPIPVAGRGGHEARPVWWQPRSDTASALGDLGDVAPFRLDTDQHFALTRPDGTPHAWHDAQLAWNHGLMNAWTRVKGEHSLAYFSQGDIPFQWALANAFTICDAYHCSMQAGTNPNRLFIWTGTNDPLARGNGPALYNDYEWFDADPGNHGGYSWTTYPERLEAAGVSWQVYENMADNYTDNPLAGFRTFRDAWFSRRGHSPSLRQRGVSTRDLDLLTADVQADKLPQVAWIVATAEGSEHPGESSPAQGAAYIARVLTALTSNPEVWSKTVLLVNFDENDGYFDHVPPPAPPSYTHWDSDPALAQQAGASTVSTLGEYHEHLLAYHQAPVEATLLHRPYGLGPRVPMYVVSPWSKGGWVNSQVFDHTSILRLIEARFGVTEPNISPWRRAVCGDLTSAFDFTAASSQWPTLPDTLARAARVKALPGSTRPVTPTTCELPSQDWQIRPSRALPYELSAHGSVQGDGGVVVTFVNAGTAGAVFHVYNRRDLTQIPRRYTVEAGKQLSGVWQPDSGGIYDLWILGPNGWHRHLCGQSLANSENVGSAANLDTAQSGQAAQLAQPAEWAQSAELVQVWGGGLEAEIYEQNKTPGQEALLLHLVNTNSVATKVQLTPLRYTSPVAAEYEVGPRSTLAILLPLRETPWYDFTITVPGLAFFGRRFAGRLETGEASHSDPGMGGAATSELFSFIPPQ